MSTKTQGIAMLLATLCMVGDGLAEEAESAAEAPALATSNSTLATFVRAVIDSNPQINAARAALDASIALEGAAGRPIYNLELEFEAENASSKTRALGISQTIDWGGKRDARTAVAESERRTVEAEYLALRWQLANELLSGLASYQTESARQDLADARLLAMRDFAALSRRRFDAGDINQIELDLATLAYADARIQKATAASNVAEAKQTVSSLAVNSPASEWPSFSAELPALQVAADNPQDLVMTLPQVRVASMRAAAAADRVELRRRERRLDPTFAVMGGKEDDDTLIGLNVTIPLPIRNRFNYEVTAAVAELGQAQQESRDVSRRAYTRLIGARDRYQVSHDAWADWDQAGELSVKSQGELLRRLWEAGEIDTTDYLVQLTLTLNTRESALDLREAVWRAWFEWLVASGQIDQWIGPGATS
jgi:cobalt-zinc-cadmium efflux system outer membrane protein